MQGTKFQKFEWTRLDKGSTVVVDLSTAANVRLMDQSNFIHYRSGQRHRYLGGLVKQAPYRIAVPRTGHWYLTVDLAGLRASSVRTRVHVEPPALPVARSSALPPLSGIRRAPWGDLTPDENGETWDVFISYASENELAVAQPLRDALRARGLTVWIAPAEMHIGDSLRRKIDYALAHSSFGVVILSKAYISKGWPQYELDGLIARTIAGQQQVLPILHEISRNEVLAYSPSLADKISRSTADRTIDEIADEIAEVVGVRQATEPE